MYCPKCSTEYRPGFTRCSDCNIALIERPIEAEPRPDPHSVELVTVFKSSDAVKIAIAKSILQSENIPFVVRGEVTQDLIGMGRFPSGYNPMIGPAEILVRREMSRDVIQMLKELENEAGPGGPKAP